MIFLMIIRIIMIQVLMPGGPKLTPSDPEKKKVMEKWVNQGAMMMRLSTVITTVIIIFATIIVILRLVVLVIMDLLQ